MTLCPHAFRRIESQLVCGRCGTEGLSALLDAAKSVIECRKEFGAGPVLDQRIRVLQVVANAIDKALEA